MSYLDAVRQWYPDAHTASHTVDRLLDLIQREYGLQPEQVMSADSICSDDLNTIEYPERAYEMLGPFKMGGLNGFPFTGLTGMGAFAAHVPVDGAVFVFHAPHVGVSAGGALGEIMRSGQLKASGCCGAARAALAKLMRDEIQAGAASELDYQQNAIEQIFYAQRDRIRGAATPLYEATEVMYEAIEARIDTLQARTKYPCARMILMGGILINGDHGEGSFCAVRRVLGVNLATGERRDLRGELGL